MGGDRLSEGLCLVVQAMSWVPVGLAATDAVHWGQGVYAVADGVDGRPGSGERALIEVVRHLGWPPARLQLEWALRAASAALWSRDATTANESSPGEGVAGVTVALWSGEQFVIGHVGDCRAILVRGGQVELLTADQGGGDVVDDDIGVARLGQPEEAARSSQIVTFHPESGDHLVLCTDGLWRHLEPSDLAAIVCAGAAEVCAALRRHAEVHSEENASAVVIGIESFDRP